MSDKPAKLTGFLSILSHATDDMPAAVQDIVKKMVEQRSFTETLQYYEIREETMLRDLVVNVVEAVDAKMGKDFENHKVGYTSFRNVMLQAISFALVAGAQLAKDKKI